MGAVRPVTTTRPVAAETAAVPRVMCSPWTLSSLATTCRKGLKFASSTRIGEPGEAALEEIGMTIADATTEEAGETTAVEGTMTVDTMTATADATTAVGGTMTADTMTATADVTAAVGGTMTVAADATTVAAGTMTADMKTAAADATTGTAVAQAGPWTTGATVKGVRGTALRKTTTLPQPLMLLRQRRHHQATRSTQPSMTLASTQPSVVVTRDLARSGIHQLLKLQHLHHLHRIRCLICLPRLLRRRRSSSSSRCNNNHPQQTRLMRSVSLQLQLHRQ